VTGVQTCALPICTSICGQLDDRPDLRLRIELTANAKLVFGTWIEYNVVTSKKSILHAVYL